MSSRRYLVFLGGFFWGNRCFSPEPARVERSNPLDLDRSYAPGRAHRTVPETGARASKSHNQNSVSLPVPVDRLCIKAKVEANAAISETAEQSNGASVGGEREGELAHKAEFKPPESAGIRPSPRVLEKVIQSPTADVWPTPTSDL